MKLYMVFGFVLLYIVDSTNNKQRFKHLYKMAIYYLLGKNK